MSIVCFRFTGTADRLRVQATVTDNDNRVIGQECNCYLAPYPHKLLEIDELEQQAYIDWLNGVNLAIPSSPPIPVETNIPDSSQSGVKSLALGQAPIEMQTNNSSFGLCKQLGARKTQLFQQWMDTPPPINNPNAPLLPNSTALQGALWQILAPAEYKKNPSNHSFVIQTDTDDLNLNRRLQRLPFHNWGFIATYDHAEVAFSTSRHAVSQPSSDRPRVFVILGDDAAIDLAPHGEAIENYLSDCADVTYWSCTKDSPLSTLGAIKHPEQNLYQTLNNSIQDNKSPTILIFVGHSSSINTQGEQYGQIRLNNQISIFPTTPAFNNILTRLRENGLIFAAFFSCNGLNIAHQLNQAQIPYILVSRDKLPVHVALISITQFLKEATKTGVSINVALQKVRQHLQADVEIVQTNNGCPNASNLLVLFQNPVQPAYILRPLTEKPVNPLPPPPPIKWWQNRNLKLLVMGIVGICLAFILQALSSILYPPSTTACDDIRPTITDKKHEYLSCGEKTLLRQDSKLTPQQKNLYDQAKEELKKGTPDYLKVVKNLENLKDDYPEISVAYYNAQAKKNLKEGLESIKTIAVMLPLSDYIKNEEADLPKSILTAVAQAQAQWNDDRKNHWNLEVILVNDFNDPANTEPVKFITQQQKILAAIGNYNSSLTKAFAPLYENKITIVSATNTATNLTIIPNYFRVTVTTDIQAENIINFLYHDKEITKVAIFSEKGNSTKSVFANSFEQSVREAGQKEDRIKILESDVFNLDEHTISNTEASEIAKRGYQAVIINSNSFTNSKLPSVITNLISTISEKSPKCLIIGNEVVADSFLVDSMKKKDIKTDNLLISLPWSETSMNPELIKNKDGKSFDATKLGDIPIRHRAYLTYDAVYLLLDAINEKAKSSKNDQEIKKDIPTQIKKMTKDGKYFGMTGPITFKGRDRAEELYGLVKVKFNDKTKALKFVKAE